MKFRLMNTRIIILGLTALIMFINISYGQEEKKESYKLYKSRSSQSNINQLLNEADALKAGSPVEALDRVQEALGLSLARGDEFNEAKCYVLVGEINENIGEWKLALENFKQAYPKLKDRYASSKEYQRTLQGLGFTNLKLGDYEESLRYYEEALTLRLTNADRMERQLDISEVYYHMERYEEAMAVLEKLDNSHKVTDPSFESRLQNQRAKIYARTNELDKTKDLYQSSLNTLRAKNKVNSKEEESLQTTKDEIVDVLRTQDRYDDEIALRNQSIEYNVEAKNFSEVTKDKVEISKTLAAKGEPLAALREVEEAARMADTLDNPGDQANAFLTLAELYEQNGKNLQALSAYKKFSEAVAKREQQTENVQLERAALIKKQKDIEELTKDVSIGRREETIAEATVFRQQLIIYGLLLIIMVVAVTSYFTYRNAQASKIANQLLALKSLRSQMNPHFIFNALNSVNHFVAQHDERAANKFLSEFSQLMRLVLENSQEDFIPLHKEQEILSLYLKLEHYRFRDKFDYELKIDDDVDSEVIEVPPMLIQPYIENAVWHGLRYKVLKGKLFLHFHKDQNNLIVEITDDGIGRKRSAELKTENQKKHNSTGLKNIEGRLAIINKVYKTNYRVAIEDLADGRGTHVRIFLPMNRKMKIA